MPLFTHQQVLKVVAGIMCCMFLAALEQTVVIPAVPAIAKSFSMLGEASWIVTAYFLAMTIALPIYGKISDRVGRTACLYPALAMFLISSVLCATAGTLLQLLFFRVLQGLGGAGLTVMAQVIIADVVSPKERGRYQVYFASVWILATAAGPPIGGWITEQLSWRFAFWLNLPVGLVAIWLCQRSLSILPQPTSRRVLDVPGSALLTVTVTLFVLLLGVVGNLRHWGAWVAFSLAALVASALALLIWHERRCPDGLFPGWLISNRTIRRGLYLGFLVSAGFLGTVFLVPLQFQIAEGSSPSTSGVLMVPFLTANVAGGYLGGQLISRLGKVRGVVGCGLVAAIVGYVTVLIAVFDDSSETMVLALTVVGGGIGMCLPTVLVLIQNAAKGQDVGTATGALLFLRSVGGTVGTALMGMLLSLSTSINEQVQLTKPEGHYAATSLRNSGITVSSSPVDVHSGFTAGLVAALLLYTIALVIVLTLADDPLRETTALEERRLA